MVTLESLHQLVSPEGQRLLETIAQAAPTPQSAIALGTWLRREWPSDLVAAGMEQYELRQLASAKFQHPAQMWFTRAGLEQASSWKIARHRADRFDGYRHVVDACCGIGGDLIALASNDPRDHVLAIDRDPVHLAMARLNLHPESRELSTFIENDVQQVAYPERAAVFIDPARRSGKGRLALGDSEPPLEWCLALAEGGRAVGIKFVPGIDHARIPDGWELETIALGHDLKEAVLWSPEFARNTRSATVIQGDATITLSRIPGDPPPIRTPEPGDILVDPNPAITRAGLVQDLARWIDSAMIDPQIAFLIAPKPVDRLLGRSLRVVASLPWNEKQVKRVLRELGGGAVDIRRRGLPGDVDAITKRLRGSGGAPHVVAMTRCQNLPWAVICTTLDQ